MKFALRRPLLLAFVMGCCISLMVSGRITLRLLIPAAVYWLFVPLCEAGSFAVVARRRDIPFAHAFDGFLKSDDWWLVWLALFAGLWAFVPARTLFSWPGLKPLWYGTFGAVAAITATLDYRFFRSVLKEPAAAATRALIVQRLLCWTACAAIFVFGAGVQVTADWLGI